MHTSHYDEHLVRVTLVWTPRQWIYKLNYGPQVIDRIMPYWTYRCIDFEYEAIDREEFAPVWKVAWDLPETIYTREGKSIDVHRAR